MSIEAVMVAAKAPRHTIAIAALALPFTIADILRPAAQIMPRQGFSACSFSAPGTAYAQAAYQ